MERGNSEGKQNADNEPAESGVKAEASERKPPDPDNLKNYPKQDNPRKTQNGVDPSESDDPEVQIIDRLG